MVLLRLDPERAEIWGDASSLIAGIKLLLGVDPKRDYREGGRSESPRLTAGSHESAVIEHGHPSEEAQGHGAEQQIAADFGDGDKAKEDRERFA
jgi:hypothetical protein